MAPFPYGYRYNLNDEAVSHWALKELDLLLHTQSAPQETAAMVLEPVLGEGGYIPAPAQFLQGLRRVCNEHDILLILDEVQTGFGRTGKFFAHEHAGIRTDILVMAKGLASGFPISAIGASGEIMARWQPGTHGGTYAGNAMGCAAAEATIQVIVEEGLVENAAARGKQLRDGLEELQSRFPIIGDVRGLGLMVGCEFTDPVSGQPDAVTSKQVLTQALQEEHLILLGCGMYANAIRWIPPLVASEAEINNGLGRFERSLMAVTG